MFHRGGGPSDNRATRHADKKHHGLLLSGDDNDDALDDNDNFYILFKIIMGAVRIW